MKSLQEVRVSLEIFHEWFLIEVKWKERELITVLSLVTLLLWVSIVVFFVFLT